MGLKKGTSIKKSVTWGDVDDGDSKNLATGAEPTSPTLKSKLHLATPMIQFKFYNIPFQSLGIIYYLLYVDYQLLIKYDTINFTLLKALPLTYFGQLLWLSTFSVAVPISEKKRSTTTTTTTTATRTKRLDLSPSLVFAATLAALLSSVVIYAVAVLLGSPILAFQSQTLLFSLHLSMLVTFPLIMVYQFNSNHWCNLIVELSNWKFLLKNSVYLVALASALGGWAGVLTIPLDWDRDWQMYPISLVIGAYLGSLVGGVLCFIGSFVPV